MITKRRHKILNPAAIYIRGGVFYAHATAAPALAFSVMTGKTRKFYPV
jgi:hypothetical protein